MNREHLMDCRDGFGGIDRFCATVPEGRLDSYHAESVFNEISQTERHAGSFRVVTELCLAAGVSLHR